MTDLYAALLKRDLNKDLYSLSSSILWAAFGQPGFADFATFEGTVGIGFPSTDVPARFACAELLMWV